MNNAPETAKEALRVLRSIRTRFSDNSQKNGSGFVGPEPGTVITCAHVVSESGIAVSQVNVGNKLAKIQKLYPDIDLAVLECGEQDSCQLGDADSLAIGDALMFSGIPVGVAGPSIFSGILSARGTGLVEFPKCELLQINGMINSGNSGGPVFRTGDMSVVGVVTAKFVPLLREIDNLRDILRNIPQFPSEVAVGQIDFAKFVNLTVRALRSISGSLRLVQVGTGYAIPVNLMLC
jgi:S1-C subfamily serine protease